MMDAKEYQQEWRSVNECIENGLNVTGNHDHSLVVFHRLRDFLKEGLFCDVTVRKGSSRQSVKAHRVVLLSAKSFDSDGNSDTETTSDSDTEETSLPTLACPDDSVFDEAYASDSDYFPAKDHMGAINHMRLQGECCDVTLEASGFEYKAHKCVLAAASDYFKAMFTSQMREKCMNCISLTEVCENEVHAPDIFDYIYTGDMTLSDRNVWPILHLSMYYQIQTLTELCQNYLISRVSKLNCCEMYSNAKSLALTNLKIESQRLMHDHFPELNEKDVINFLEKSDLELMLPSDSLGKSSVPCKRTESCILRTVLKWLQNVNFQHSDDLLKHIRITLIPKTYIMHCQLLVSKFRNGIGDTNLMFIDRFVDDALRYHDMVSEQPLLQTNKSQLRDDNEIWVCVDGVLAPTAVKLPPISYHAKSPTEEQNRDSFSQKIRDPFHSVVILNGFIYAIGGTRQTSIGYSNSVIRYDSRLDSWKTMTSMNEPRGDFFACTIGDFLYVFGGKNKRGALRSCERYDPRTDQWEKISDLPEEGLYMMAGVVLGGVVYISGGFNDYEAVGKTLRYTVESDTWDVLPAALFKDRGYHVMVYDNQGYIWTFGGVDSPFSGRNVWEVERFNVECEYWEYYGQVLAVQPFLSVQRLNVFLDKDGNICVFAVTNIDQSPSLRFNISKNIWERLDQPIECHEIEYNPSN